MSTRNESVAVLPERQAESTADPAAAYIATIVSLTPDNTPEVRLVAGGPVVSARLAVPATRERIEAAITHRQQAVVVFEGGDRSKPIVIGFLAPIETEAPVVESEESQPPQIIEADVDESAFA